MEVGGTMFGVIIGTGLREDILVGLSLARIDTDLGEAYLYVGQLGGAEIALLPRHGLHRNVPAHMIDHRLNMAALMDLEVSGILGISSCGSLKRHIAPPSLMLPDDYINFDPVTMFDDRIENVLPGFDEELRTVISKAFRATGISLHGRGTYVQTRGSRLETKAEVNMLAQYADIVGMTMASEATLSKEAGIPFASVCTIDNFAHGIGGYIKVERIRAAAQQNVEAVWKGLERVVQMV